MNAQQVKRRRLLRALAEHHRRREEYHRDMLEKARARDAFCASAQDCDGWASERVDDDNELPAPTAHQRLRAAVFTDALVLDFMRSTVPPEHPFEVMHGWRSGESSDIRRAFPADATAEQIVVKLWDMRHRGLIEGNLYMGVFWLPDEA
jgi:hypothetical protein